MADKSPYVLVSVFKEDAKEQDVAQAAGKIAAIIDDWNGQGNMIWSGSLMITRLQCQLLKEIRHKQNRFLGNITMHANHFFHHTCMSGMQCRFCHY